MGTSSSNGTLTASPGSPEEKKQMGWSRVLSAWRPELGAICNLEGKSRQLGLALASGSSCLTPALCLLTCSNTESPSQSPPRTHGAWTRTSCTSGETCPQFGPTLVNACLHGARTQWPLPSCSGGLREDRPRHTQLIHSSHWSSAEGWGQTMGTWLWLGYREGLL